MFSIDQNDNGRELTLAVGEVMELSLVENRTTGYHWELKDKASPVCELVKEEFEPPAGATGSGGIHRWQFQAVRAGSGELHLQYRRHWEQHAEPARTFRMGVRVRNAKNGEPTSLSG